MTCNGLVFFKGPNVNPSEPGRTVCRDTSYFGYSVYPHHARKTTVSVPSDSAVLTLIPD
jgi:hypothetical protein